MQHLPDILTLPGNFEIVEIHSVWFIKATVRVESGVAANFCLKFTRLGSKVASILHDV